MLAVDRRKGILEKLKATGSITVAELSTFYGVSEETIRRDLTRMEGDGLLEKTYGGAYIKDGMHREVPFALRNVAYVRQKELIGRRGGELVEHGDTIFLDASTTALHVGQSIIGKHNLIVISNALAVSYRLAEAPDIKMITIGGTLRRTSLTNVGRAAEDSIVRYYADKTFFSCDGVDRDHGITDANEKEAEVRKAMLSQSKQRILVADHTKFDRTSFVLIDNFENVDTVITDRPVSEEWMRFFQNKNIEYISCVEEAGE
ncbi:MAG: DeoR family transcriptional regulator [Spirochaetes bacterium]|nr:DeoR family transcriptional regulator [Spirochaetota bacterium]